MNPWMSLSGFVSAVLSPVMTGVLVAVALVLGTTGWMLIRRRHVLPALARAERESVLLP